MHPFDICRHINAHERWQHKRSGDIYRILLIANKSAEDREKFPVTIVYVDNIGRTWSRNALDFIHKFKPFKRSSK